VHRNKMCWISNRSHRCISLCHAYINNFSSGITLNYCFKTGITEFESHVCWRV